MLLRRLTHWRVLVVGWLLMSANSALWIDKPWFYPLKDHLLRRYGESTGHRLQHIFKGCRACDGTGLWADEECDRCLGSGIYDKFWVTLEVWRVGSYSFLLPLQRHYSRRTLPEWAFEREPDIKGYVTHRAHWANNEAKLWLTLLFDRHQFWSLLSSRVSNRMTWRGWLPLCTVQRLVCWTLSFWRFWVQLPHRVERWRNLCQHWLYWTPPQDRDYDDIPF